jgi:hypothetical protein
MRTQLSPGIAAAIVAAVILLIGAAFWMSTRTKPTVGRKPVQAMGQPIPEQPVIPQDAGH